MTILWPWPLDTHPAIWEVLHPMKPHKTLSYVLTSGPGVPLSVSPSGGSHPAHRAPHCWTAGTRAVCHTWRSPTTRPPSSRHHFLWWTSCTWCSLEASSEWAALCGHQPGGEGVNKEAWVTFTQHPHYQRKRGLTLLILIDYKHIRKIRFLCNLNHQSQRVKNGQQNFLNYLQFSLKTR